MNVTVEEVLKRAENLRPPPVVMARLLEVVNDPTHTAERVQKILSVDAAMTSAALRLANSAAYARSGSQVAALDAALARVGEQQLVRMVVTRAAECVRVESVPGYEHPDFGLWKHALRTAIAAEKLAERTGAVVPGEAYAAGLLVDIGKLALGSVLQRRRESVIARAQNEPDTDFDEIEREEMGLDHAELGARLAQRWELPVSLVEAIRYHHAPEQAGDRRPLAYTVHVADVLAQMASGSGGLDGMHYGLHEGWHDYVPIDRDDVEVLILEIEEAVAAAEDLLD